MNTVPSITNNAGRASFVDEAILLPVSVTDLLSTSERISTLRAEYAAAQAFGAAAWRAYDTAARLTMKLTATTENAAEVTRIAAVAEAEVAVAGKASRAALLALYREERAAAPEVAEVAEAATLAADARAKAALADLIAALADREASGLIAGISTSGYVDHAPFFNQFGYANHLQALQVVCDRALTLTS